MEQEDNRTKLLKKIKNEVLNPEKSQSNLGASLKESPLYRERIKNGTFPVIGEGGHYAKIMFIGEAPGKNEAMTGRPFCGTAGKILDELLTSVGIARQDVYITNIVKDRPPSNRDPLPEEIRIYGPFLDRQLEIIRPEVIATLGRFSMEYIIKKFGLEPDLKPIGQMRGRVFEAQAGYGKVKIIPLYHPAASIYNRELRSILEQDFRILKNFE